MPTSGVRAYFSLDPRSLAAFRTGLGLIVLCDFIERSRQLEAHYTDFGLMPRDALRALSAHPIYSLHMLGGSVAFEAALFVVSGLAAIFLALGLFTRWASVLTYVMLFSVQARNPLVNHGGDDFELTLLMWAPFLPLGATWSLDALRGAAAAPRAFSSGSVGVVLQPLMLYVVVTFSKFQYPCWTEGRAVYGLLHKAHYVRPLGAFALTIPGFTAFATYATMVTEIAIVCLLASPWRTDAARTVGIALNTAFHSALFSMVDIGLFQPLAALAALPLLPGALWDRFPRLRLPTPHAVSTPTPLGPLARIGEAVCAAIVVVSIVSVPPSLFLERFSYPEPLASAYRIFRLERRYRMFANMDVTPQGWWVAVGTLENGRKVDAQTGSSHVGLERPPNYAASLPNDAWRMYWSNISRAPLAPFRPYLAEYFCRRWNRAAKPGARMTSIEVIQVKERATHPDRPIVRRPVTLVGGPCPSAGSAHHAR